MTQDESSRLDRIETALAEMQEQMQQSQTRMDQEFDRQRQRMDQEFDRQMQLNAEFRTQQQMQLQSIIELREANAIELEREYALRQNIELLVDNMQSLIEAFRQHRSDGHGA